MRVCLFYVFYFFYFSLRNYKFDVSSGEFVREDRGAVHASKSSLDMLKSQMWQKSQFKEFLLVDTSCKLHIVYSYYIHTYKTFLRRPNMVTKIFKKFMPPFQKFLTTPLMRSLFRPRILLLVLRTFGCLNCSYKLVFKKDTQRFHIIKINKITLKIPAVFFSFSIFSISLQKSEIQLKSIPT